MPASAPFRWRLRTLLIAVAALALILGLAAILRTRRERLAALSHQHSVEANRLENLLEGDVADREALLRQVHWHDSVAHRFRRASERPWTSFVADPGRGYCDCPMCRRP